MANKRAKPKKIPAPKARGETQISCVSVFLLGRNREVTVCRKSIKNSYIHVKNKGIVTLSVPLHATDEKIERILKERRDWIEKQLAKREARFDMFAPFRFTDGAILRYFGQDRVLRLLKSDKNRAAFEEEPFVIRLYLKDPADEALAARTFSKAVRLVLENVIQKFTDDFMPIFDKKGVMRPEIRIRKMRSIWGCCAFKKGRITMNERLFQAPLPSIEYVVLHELTHFLYHGHDRKFYAFVEKYMPDWKTRRSALNGENISLETFG